MNDTKLKLIDIQKTLQDIDVDTKKGEIYIDEALKNISYAISELDKD